MRASFSRHRRWQNHIITGAYLLSRYNNNNSSIRYLFLNLELNRSPVLILSNNELTSHQRERERGGDTLFRVRRILEGRSAYARIHDITTVANRRN